MNRNAFDSDFFGLECWELECDDAVDNFNTVVEHMITRVPLDDTHRIQGLLAEGYRYVCTSCTYEGMARKGTVTDDINPISLVFPQNCEIETVYETASYFSLSRFHRDPLRRIRDKADDLYRRWILNRFQGDNLFVAKKGDVVWGLGCNGGFGLQRN